MYRGPSARGALKPLAKEYLESLHQSTTQTATVRKATYRVPGSGGRVRLSPKEDKYSHYLVYTLSKRDLSSVEKKTRTKVFKIKGAVAADLRSVEVQRHFVFKAKEGGETKFEMTVI